MLLHRILSLLLVGAVAAGCASADSEDAGQAEGAVGASCDSFEPTCGAQCKDGFKYITKDTRVILPKAPKDKLATLEKLAATSEVRSALGERFLTEMNEGEGKQGNKRCAPADQLTHRYRAVVGEYKRLIANDADAKAAIGKFTDYVQGGENLDPNAAPSAAPGKQLYRELNGAMYEAQTMEAFERRYPELHRYFTGELLPAFQRIPGKVDGMVFRGAMIEEQKAKEYVKGTRADYSQIAPMSTSASVFDALTFLGRQLTRKKAGFVPTLMAIKAKSGKLISFDTSFAFEEEVLLIGGKFKVTRAFMEEAPRDDSGEKVLYLFMEET